ncbi:MAG: response regulator [Deltaproteobacteria bacterium]|nr:response regulator [Deltaproteobacteria bacterium]
MLLVDDEPMLLQALARLLRRTFDVSVSSAPAAAIEDLRTGTFDAVVCDLVMPGLSGVQVLAAARRYSPHTARVLLTGGIVSDALPSPAEHAEIHRVLQKPVSLDELTAVLRELIAAGGTRGEAP